MIATKPMVFSSTVGGEVVPSSVLCSSVIGISLASTSSSWRTLPANLDR